MNIKINFGKYMNYVYKDIKTDSMLGFPIIVDDFIVGGISGRSSNNRKIYFLEGIEILKQFRQKGLATAVIEQLKKQYPIIIGSVDEYDVIPFWKKRGALFYEMPKRLVPEHIIKKLKTKEILGFMITKNKDEFDNFIDKLNKKL